MLGTIGAWFSPTLCGSDDAAGEAVVLCTLEDFFDDCENYHSEKRQIDITKLELYENRKSAILRINRVSMADFLWRSEMGRTVAIGIQDSGEVIRGNYLQP